MNQPDLASLEGFSFRQLPEGFYDDPYPWYAALRQHAPVLEVSPGTWLITRYEDVLQIYRDASASSAKDREFLPRFGPSPLLEHHTTSQVFSDPPRHTRLRRIIMGALTQRAIARMQEDVTGLVGRLLDGLEEPLRDGEAVDWIDQFAAAIPVEVIGNLLSFPRQDRQPLRRWSLAILAALEPNPTPQMLDDGNRAVVEFIDLLRVLIAERRAHPLNPEEDVLTRLIQGEKGEDGRWEELSEAELLHNCIFLLNAGHETTTNLIGNGIGLMLSDPALQDRLRSQPAIMPQAVEEFLRYDSPVQLNSRMLTRPTVVGGHTLPEGAFLTLCIGAANRDPGQFADPDRFIADRKPNRHLAFGQGAHACSGMNVARMEGRVAFALWLERFGPMVAAQPAERDRRARFRGLRHLWGRLA